jgi:hypothetical protein
MNLFILRSIGPAGAAAFALCPAELMRLTSVRMTDAADGPAPASSAEDEATRASAA